MKPEFNSKRLLAITRSKAKMYEFGLPEESHLEVPQGSNPEELFLLTVGVLGDISAMLNDSEDFESISSDLIDDLNFSASFFDAFLESRFNQTLNNKILFLAASSYFLIGRPGSSNVIARRINYSELNSSFEIVLAWLLKSDWTRSVKCHHKYFGHRLELLVNLVKSHFAEGTSVTAVKSTLKDLKREVYQIGTSEELLYADILSAIIHVKINASVWVALPRFTDIEVSEWSPSIKKHGFPKELWPAQLKLGQSGIFSGSSGVVQMPTSAGKTRSIEIIIRSSFLSNRSDIAIVVAPFRALCHEIGTALRRDFSNENVKVNELTDALQLDFLSDIAELFGTPGIVYKCILVVTPEKLLYVLRQSPSLLNKIGLVIYDEGHQFDSGTRGVTYELLLTEIKSLLPSDAQTILVSAVIQNADEVGSWLIGENVKIVNGVNLLPTARSVAFASWLDKLGQLLFFDSNNYYESDYFVPRVIEQIMFDRLPRQKKDRFFPEKSDSNDLGLYLGLKLVPQGGVAIFCGRKDSAIGFAKRAVEIYSLGLDIAPPSNFSDQNEIKKLSHLLTANYGDNSIYTRAALLGVFVHHGTTPQGIRLSTEYAMQNGLIKFIACTSTLAQGVNLPIRYLIVPGVYQGQEKIKVRDFQNLVGRAGRSGMHTEGLVIFADTDVYDNRFRESWRFESARQLLTPELSEVTTSSILEILRPILSDNKEYAINMSAGYLADLLLNNRQEWEVFIEQVTKQNPFAKFNPKKILLDLAKRRKLLHAIESHLMANRGDLASSEFSTSVERLAASTLAYHLSSDETRNEITILFSKLAEYLQIKVPDSSQQAIFSKTLLGVEDAIKIEQWVESNREVLLSADSHMEYLAIVWSLFLEINNEKFFHTTEPKELAYHIASKWLKGCSYDSIFQDVIVVRGSKPFGENKRRALSIEDVVSFCDNTLSFECGLISAAIAEFLSKDSSKNTLNKFNLFQKSLKYGLSNSLSISVFEMGFSDRSIATRISDFLISKGYENQYLGKQDLHQYYFHIEEILEEYPSYFQSVLESL